MPLQCSEGVASGSIFLNPPPVYTSESNWLSFAQKLWSLFFSLFKVTLKAAFPNLVTVLPKVFQRDKGHRILHAYAA